MHQICGMDIFLPKWCNKIVRFQNIIFAPCRASRPVLPTVQRLQIAPLIDWRKAPKNRFPLLAGAVIPVRAQLSRGPIQYTVTARLGAVYSWPSMPGRLNDHITAQQLQYWTAQQQYSAGFHVNRAHKSTFQSNVSGPM